MRRFTDVSGTYKMVTSVGFDKFACAMGEIIIAVN
jgi:hypothetical protein